MLNMSFCFRVTSRSHHGHITVTSRSHKVLLSFVIAARPPLILSLISGSWFPSLVCIYIYIYILYIIYTGCPRRKVPDFGRVFLMLKYTDITQNTYIQSWTVTEVMAREFWNFDSCYTLIDYQINIKNGRNMCFL